MCDDLSQDRLGLVPKRVVGRLVPVRCELEWFLELPLEVQRQAHGNLVASKSCAKNARFATIIMIREINYVHVLRRHLELILAQGVQPTQCDVRMGDAVLSCREQLEIISGLQNCAIVRRNVQAWKKKKTALSSPPKKTNKRHPQRELTTTQRRSPWSRSWRGPWRRSCGPRSCGLERRL